MSGRPSCADIHREVPDDAPSPVIRPSISMGAKTPGIAMLPRIRRGKIPAFFRTIMSPFSTSAGNCPERDREMVKIHGSRHIRHQVLHEEAQLLDPGHPPGKEKPPFLESHPPACPHTCRHLFSCRHGWSARGESSTKRSCQFGGHQHFLYSLGGYTGGIEAPDDGAHGCSRV